MLCYCRGKEEMRRTAASITSEQFYHLHFLIALYSRQQYKLICERSFPFFKNVLISFGCALLNVIRGLWQFRVGGGVAIPWPSSPRGKVYV